MKIRLIVMVAALAFACSSQVLGQGGVGLQSAAPRPTPVEPVDATFVPQVESKTEALEIVSVVRRDPILRLRVKNVSAKNIYSFRMKYHRSGLSQLFSYVLSDEKTFLAPGEVYKYDYSYFPNSVFARESLTFEAVLFEDGTGDGVPEKVKSIQEVFLRNRKELEHVLATLQVALESPNVETRQGLEKLRDSLSQTPDYMYGFDMQGLAGLTVASWRGTAMGRVADVLEATDKGSAGSIRESLSKIRDDFNKTLAKYPRGE